MWLLMWRAVLSWRRGHRFLPLLIKVSFRVSFLSNIIGAGIISPQHSLLCQWEYFMSSRSRSTNSFQKVWTCSRVLTNNWVSGWRTMYCIRLHQQFVEGMRLSFSNINHRKKPIWGNDLSKVAFNQCGTFVFFFLVTVGRTEWRGNSPCSLQVVWCGRRFSALRKKLWEKHKQGGWFNVFLLGVNLLTPLTSHMNEHEPSFQLGLKPTWTAFWDWMSTMSTRSKVGCVT